MADNNEPFITFVDPNEIPNKPTAQQSVVTSDIQPTEPAQITEPVVTTTTPSAQPVHAQAMVRTYHKDVSQVMGQNNPRIMSDILAGARNEEAQKEAKNPISPKNKKYVIGSIAFLLLGLSVLGFAVYRNYATVQTLRQGEQLSLIRAETHTNVTLADNELFKNRGRVTQALITAIPAQTINHIFFTKQSITGLVRLGFTDLIASTGGTIPQQLMDTLDPNFMYGTYQSDAPLPFLILRVNNYDDAFDGLRTWEPLMVDHLGFLFNLPEALQSNFNKSRFQDRVIANHNVRAVIYHAEPVQNQIDFIAVEPSVMTVESTEATPLAELPDSTESTTVSQTATTPEIETLPTVPQETAEPILSYEEGDTVLLYTFLNERTILITTSESVLREILFRLTNAQLLI